MGKEIERKFVIEMPSAQTLFEASAESSEIEQTYLAPTSEFPTRRVRKRSRNGTVEYTYTQKRSEGKGFTRTEVESRIDQGEYHRLLAEKEPDTHTINKTRYCIKAKDGHVLEIDVFDFWQSYAILEIELAAEDEQYVIPPYIVVAKEVTTDPRFYNVRLAKTVPDLDGGDF